MSWKSPKPIFPQLPHTIWKTTKINALGGGTTASGSGGSAWEPVLHCSWQCRTCPVATANPDGKPPLAAAADRRVWCPPKWELRKQKLLSPNFGIQNFKKNLYETNTCFFRWKRFWNKQKLQPIIECKWPLVLGQDDSAQCCKSSFNDKYITAPHHADLNWAPYLPSDWPCRCLRLKKRLSNMNYLYRSCFLSGNEFFCVPWKI